MQRSLSSANHVRFLFLPCPALSIRGRDTQKTEEGLSAPQERTCSSCHWMSQSGEGRGSISSTLDTSTLFLTC
ncbi:hypothetical protein AV530_015188 [Patagioenas fasciata monilis]|uniref:Uncharacterized protein n=1 Tax=Patagioenas fasciata monilis TaxID=372326 RepID=A0A1V4K188_PATFA|nr:hypothetical protein AV530_015188 [Patagioenas fasciata monilis]